MTLDFTDSTDATLAKKSTRKSSESGPTAVSQDNTLLSTAVLDSVSLAPDIEEQTQQTGRSVWGHLARRRPSFFERRWWDDRILAAAMADESLKVQMFRFVDVLPRLRTHREVTRHLQEYFLEVKEHLPLAIEMVRFGIGQLSPESVLSRALAYNARGVSLRVPARRKF